MQRGCILREGEALRPTTTAEAAAYGLGLGAGAALVISLTYAVLALVRCAGW